jgi:hypothetical protein
VIEVEKRTLEAINELQDQKYPYAATMLVYLVLERLRKRHLLQYRQTLTAKEVDLDTKVGLKKDKRLGDAKTLDNRSFVRSFLVDLTLHDLQKIYRIPEKKYSKDRNDVFHSNLVLMNQLESDYESRDAQNRQYLETAKQHLVEASELCFPQWRIIESSGQLQYGS